MSDAAEVARLKDIIFSIKAQLWNYASCEGCMERICECWIYRIKRMCDIALKESK